MGRRSKVLDNEQDVLQLSLQELDAEIARVKRRSGLAPSSMMRKLYEKRIHWLEAIRARHPEANPS